MGVEQGRWRTQTVVAASWCGGLFFIFFTLFYFSKKVSPPGVQLVVMGQPITVHPNLKDLGTGSDGIFDLAVIALCGVVLAHREEVLTTRIGSKPGETGHHVFLSS